MMSQKRQMEYNSQWKIVPDCFRSTKMIIRFDLFSCLLCLCKCFCVFDYISCKNRHPLVRMLRNLYEYNSVSMSETEKKLKCLWKTEICKMRIKNSWKKNSFSLNELWKFSKNFEHAGAIRVLIGQRSLKTLATQEGDPMVLVKEAHVARRMLGVRESGEGIRNSAKLQT